MSSGLLYHPGTRFVFNVVAGTIKPNSDLYNASGAVKEKLLYSLNEVLLDPRSDTFIRTLLELYSFIFKERTLT